MFDQAKDPPYSTDKPWIIRIDIGSSALLVSKKGVDRATETDEMPCKIYPGYSASAKQLNSPCGLQTWI